MEITMNHFKLLDLEQKYDIDRSELQKQYLSKQALYHPDRASTEALRTKNLDISMQLNEAYNILKDDYMRAEYLLKLLGQKFDDRTLKDALPPAELEVLMASHEDLEAIEDLSNLQILKASKLREKTQKTQELTECFLQNNISKALEITIGLKYLTNLVKNIDFKIKHADN